MAGKILVVSTSYSGNLGSQPTGSWVEEIAAPYFEWRTRGMSVTIASIKGGDIFFDPSSTSGDFCTPEAEAFLKGKETAPLIKNTKAIGDFTDEELDLYDAIFLPGGHGMMFDGPDSAELKHALEYMASKGKIISAVCHGPGGLVESVVKGKRVTGFTNGEEGCVGKMDLVPFSLEDRLKEFGATFECGPDWSSHVVVDGKLITGQNPQSSLAVGQAVGDAVLPGIEPQHGKGPGEGFHARGHPVTGEHHEHGDDKVPTHPQAITD